jgi:hypothetical protein
MSRTEDYLIRFTPFIVSEIAIHDHSWALQDRDVGKRI